MSTSFHEVDAIKAFISHIKDKHIRWHLEDAFQSWSDSSYRPNDLEGWKDKKIAEAIKLYLDNKIDMVQLDSYKGFIQSRREAFD